MLVPLSWLRDFAPFDDDAGRLRQTFDELGMVVEGVTRVGEGLGGVFVARVLEIHAIPRADRIRRVLVDDGTGDAVQVVCGAWNFEVGDIVPFARVGAVLPGDFEIGRRKMKGVESAGMICSARELELGTESAGIMVLPGNLPVGAPLTEALGLERDVVFDLAIEGNRPDANSMAGVARDAAAKLRLPFSIADHPVDRGPQVAGQLASAVDDAPELCPRFTATVITGVAVGPSSPLVARRLTLAGMRPISNVVDASNYVMLELGQPTHPYDLDRLPGRGLLVRPARRGETIVTLDGVERRVGDGDDCLICDAEGTPVGIGGIMGGASSEISDQTTDVLLEAAYFTPMAIARTSKRLGLRSEASARFERGTDPEGIERSVERFCSLLGSGQVAQGMVDVRFVEPRRQSIRVRVERVNRLLGTELDAEAIVGYLSPIGFESATADEAGVLSVTPPTFRPDAALEVDVIEEVARHHGYRSIQRTVPLSPFVGALTPYQRARRRLQDVLAGAGYNEAIVSPLLAPGDHDKAGLVQVDEIVAVDPLAREESILRASLLPGLLRSVAFNVAHRTGEVRLFEVGNVFTAHDRTAELPLETERVALVVAGTADGVTEAKRVLDLVLDVFHADARLVPAADVAGWHPTRTAAVVVGGDLVGHVGEIDPAVVERYGVEGRIGAVDVDASKLLPAERRYVEAVAVSKLPSTDIDLAFVVDDAVPAGDLQATIRGAAGELLVDLALFDVYRGSQVADGHRSLAYRLRFQALDRTLTDAEVATIRQRIIDAAGTAHHATLR